MSDIVQLVGLDFGTTTSSAVVATATLVKSATTGRMELSSLQERYRSEMVFTPFDADHRLDEGRAEVLLDAWLGAGGVRAEEVFGGGALLTGLTAQTENAAALVRLIRRRLNGALVAAADDPCLESWLAFMGSCAALSRAHPRQPLLNLDIGGGTTNLAWGRDGAVAGTGCLFVGARHVQVVPGTYRIERLSRYAAALFEHLRIAKRPGESLADGELHAILDFYLELLKAAATGDREPFSQPVARLLEQVAMLPSRENPAPSLASAAVTFSGGVGELIYAHFAGAPWPPPTHYGDLGIDLAQRIVAAPYWIDRMQGLVPASAGRATVYGLLRHSTEISGSTLFLPQPGVLPWSDVPILGSLASDSTAEHVRGVVELIGRSQRGGCATLRLGTHDAAAVRAMGLRLAAAIDEARLSPAHPVLLLVEENVGKVLGHYLTRWGQSPRNVVVVDEVAVRDAQYVHVGAPRGQAVPISFYGLNN